MPRKASIVSFLPWRAMLVMVPAHPGGAGTAVFPLPAAQRNRKAMDHLVEPARAPGAALYNAIDPLSENPSWTAARFAEKPPRSENQRRTPASNREVDKSAHVTAMNTKRRGPTKRPIRKYACRLRGEAAG